MLGGGGVAGELPLDPLQSVAQLPQRMAEGLGFLFGCGGLVAKAGAFVGEVSPPLSELLGGVRSGATAVGCLADTDAELLTPCVEALSILGRADRGRRSGGPAPDPGRRVDCGFR